MFEPWLLYCAEHLLYGNAYSYPLLAVVLLELAEVGFVANRDVEPYTVVLVKIHHGSGIDILEVSLDLGRGDLFSVR